MRIDILYTPIEQRHLFDQGIDFAILCQLGFGQFVQHTQHALPVCQTAQGDLADDKRMTQYSSSVQTSCQPWV